MQAAHARQGEVQGAGARGHGHAPRRLPLANEGPGGERAASLESTIDVTNARRKFAFRRAPLALREGSWLPSGLERKAADGGGCFDEQGGAMGDEMDVMIPEREMKVRDWPGPPSLPGSRRCRGAPPPAPS